MRLSMLLVPAALAALPGGALACGAPATACLPAAVAFPVYTHEGLRVGEIVSPVRLPLSLEISPYTGQPIAVVYNDPARLPGSVSRLVELVPLPRAKPFRTKAVYPRGY